MLLAGIYFSGAKHFDKDLAGNRGHHKERGVQKSEMVLGCQAEQKGRVRKQLRGVNTEQEKY